MMTKDMKAGTMPMMKKSAAKKMKAKAMPMMKGKAKAKKKRAGYGVTPY